MPPVSVAAMAEHLVGSPEYGLRTCWRHIDLACKGKSVWAIWVLDQHRHWLALPGRTLQATDALGNPAPASREVIPATLKPGNHQTLPGDRPASKPAAAR